MKQFYLYITFAIGCMMIPIQSMPLNAIEYEKNSDQTDSITLWISFAKDKNLKLNKRVIYLENAYKKTLQLKNDTLKNRHLSKIAYRYKRLSDSARFRKVNKLTIELSQKLGDSITLGYNYWDLGTLFENYEVNDSAYFNYFKAQKLFDKVGNNYFSAIMLMNMGIIQSDLRDYTGSEVTTIKAIELFKTIGKDDHLYKCYNNLGVVFNELHEYDKALFYHKKALEYESLSNSGNPNRENSLNNIGVVYNNNKQYQKAEESFKKALLRGELKHEDPKLYAKLLDNLAYSKIKLVDTLGVGNLFKESSFIRDSINDTWGKSMGKLHRAEYYLTNKDSLRAIQLVYEAKSIAEYSKNYRDILASLMLLSKLDKENSGTYTQQYITINNKLQEEERAVRDKFARIRFETDQFIEENEALIGEKELLSEQRNRILIIAFTIFILGTLIYIIRDQRLKNIRLKLEKEQQLANEEIYNLMLKQQNKIDEVKRNEKKRISEELHDGVLGNIYGIKMNLAVLNAQNTPEAIEKRQLYIEGLANVVDEIRNVSHELHANAIDANVGYIQLIEELLSKNSELKGYNYELRTDNSTNWPDIQGDIKMNIYRIIQEAIQNINKYAKAKNVKVYVKSENNKIHLTISDDGVGFNTATNKVGIGIKNMKSRLERLNGKVEFNSVINEGTSILIEIPCG